MKVHKISGRVTFEPDLSSYPFDTQRVSIDIQPKRGNAPFIVQPPPASQPASATPRLPPTAGSR